MLSQCCFVYTNQVNDTEFFQIVDCIRSPKIDAFHDDVRILLHPIDWIHVKTNRSC